jgi:hypothetical protein
MRLILTGAIRSSLAAPAETRQILDNSLDFPPDLLYSIYEKFAKNIRRRAAAAVPELIVSRRPECLEWRLARGTPDALAVTWYGRLRQVNGQVDYIRADGDERIAA